MFAIVELGGKQYKVQEKDILVVEKIDAKAGDSVENAKVLLFSDGKDTQIGTPYLKNAKLNLKVMEQGRAEKVRVFKMSPKKRRRKLHGHRQHLTKVEVTKIAVA